MCNMRFLIVTQFMLLVTLSTVIAQKTKISNSKATGIYTITNPCGGSETEVLESYKLPETIKITMNGKNNIVVNAGYDMVCKYNSNKIAGGSVLQLTFEKRDEETYEYLGGGSIMITEEGIELHWLQGKNEECMTIYKKSK